MGCQGAEGFSREDRVGPKMNAAAPGALPMRSLCLVCIHMSAGGGRTGWGRGCEDLWRADQGHVPDWRTVAGIWGG